MEHYKKADDVKESLKAGRYFVEQYARKNLSDAEAAELSVEDVDSVSAIDGWSVSANNDDKKVHGTIELKYKEADGINDVYGHLYYVVHLREKIRHFFLPGWFDDMDAPVKAVVLLRPRYKGLIEPMEELERTMVVANWEYANKYKGADDVYSGKWNHYMAGTSSDRMAVKYENNNPYRTESVGVKTVKRSGDNGSDGQSTGANGGKFYGVKEVDSLNLDFQAEVRVKGALFTTDWDLGMEIPNFDNYSQTSNDSWGVGNGDDKRILYNVEFNEAFPTRDNKKQVDPLWIRIESDPIIPQKNIKNENVTVYNSVRQITLNFNTDNSAIGGSGDNKYYTHRPYVIFYTGPENIDNVKDSNGVLIRHSQPVVLNLNADLNAIIYMPNSPVIINGNNKKWRGFIIAKCFLKSVTREDMLSLAGFKRYDGFNALENFSGGYSELTDGYGNTVYVMANKLLDKSNIITPREEYTEKVDDGTISYYKKVPERILLKYTKADHEQYAVTDADGKHNEAKTFAAYVNATYKETFKAFSGLDDSQITAVTFPNENYNETTATYYVSNDDIFNLDDPYLNQGVEYAKVLVGNEAKYIVKSKLPYVKVRTNKDYFYVSVYDLKLAWDGATVNNDSTYSGVRMIDNSYTDAEINNSYKSVKDKGIKTADNEYKDVKDNATASDADIYINPNDKWCDSWGIENTLLATYKSNWKKNKLEEITGSDNTKTIEQEKNGVTYFRHKDDVNALKTPKRIACYRKVTYYTSNKYINENKTDYYMKIDNNKNHPENKNYIIVDKNGNILTKPVTAPEVLTAKDVTANKNIEDSVKSQSNSVLGNYWNEYTRYQNGAKEGTPNYNTKPEELPDDHGQITDDGKYVGSSEYHKYEDYRIPALERVYKMSTFNLNTDSCYSYFDIKDLERVNYKYLNVNEVYENVLPNNENGDEYWKVDDMFFTTIRAKWVD